MQKLRLAIAGAGWVTEHCYLPHLLADDRYAVTAIYDPVRERAQQLATKLPNLLTSSSFENALEGADAVLLAHPSPLHVRDSLCALSKGIVVLSEKPIAARIRDVIALRDAADAARVRFIPARVCRHRSDVACWKRLVDKIGSIRSLDLIWQRQRGVPAAPWQLSYQDGMTGVLADLGHHLLDLAAWILPRGPISILSAAFVMGDVEPASWYGANSGRFCDVPVAANLDLNWNGTHVNVDVAWVSSNLGDVTELRAVGECGEATLRGLFGFSPERRIPTQTVELRSGTDRRVNDFEPGAALHRAAFAGVLKELLPEQFCNTYWDDILSVASVLECADELFQSQQERMSTSSSQADR